MLNATYLITLTRETLIGYRTAVDDLQARLQALSDKHDHLRSYVDAKSDQLTSSWSEIDRLQGFCHEEQSKNQELRETLMRRTAELAAAMMDSDMARASRISTEREAHNLTAQLQACRMEKDDLQRIVGEMGDTCKYAIDAEPRSEPRAGDVVELRAVRSLGAQHGYSLRSRTKPRLRRKN